MGGLRLSPFEGLDRMPAHPARLRPEDLDNPAGWRERLVAWLMKQH